MPRRTASYLSRSRLEITAWADWRDTEYSVEQPPKRIQMFFFIKNASRSVICSIQTKREAFLTADFLKSYEIGS